jgi:hypothetical protein
MGREHLENLGANGRIILIQILKIYGVTACLDSIASGKGPVACLCEINIEFSVSIKTAANSNQLNGCQLLKKNSTQYNNLLRI